jgi:putative FmdB family regulatory protein
VPVYTYKCDECDEIFEKFHLMSETLEDCVLCEGTDCVERVPSSLLARIIQEKSPKKVGDLVESHIKQARNDLEKEKKDLKNKEA